MSLKFVFIGSPPDLIISGDKKGELNASFNFVDEFFHFDLSDHYSNHFV